MVNVHFQKKSITRALVLALLLLNSTLMFAQSVVTGNVKDQSGEPLIGVSVLEQGTSNGTVTDFDGNFSFTVAQGKTVNFSYIGYKPQSVVVRGSIINVVLEEENTNLNEVVVVGYGTMRRKDVTSSITTVKAEDLNRGVFTDPASMLQGKVAGLTVTTTGDPNGGASITLRGASSLRTGAAMEPYYVIDGIPGVDISMVAPDDIESIDVLRDASATAIYGSKAANGVIIITTKSGQEGRTNVTYNGYAAFDKVLKTLDMASASQLRSSGLIGSEQDGGGDTDWQKEVLRTGISHNHNVSISGGNAKTKYMGSINYLNREGVVIGTGMNRVNARTLFTTSILKDRLEISLGVNAMQGKHKGVPQAASTGADAGKSVLDAMNYYSPTNPVYDADGGWYESYIGSANYNPLSMIYEDGNQNEWRRIQYITKGSLKLFKGLVWHANYSYDSGQNTYSWYQTHQTQMDKGYDGRAHRDTYLRHNQTFETYGNYDVTINKVHKLGLMAGYSWEERVDNDGFGVTVNNFYNDVTSFWNLRYANNINGITDVQGSSRTKIRNISFYGRLNYSFNSRYMLQATIRRDGSSVFGKEHRWGTFPSASIAWNITEEGFMKNQNLFDQLKLRVGYGVSGNAMGFGAYDAIATYGLSGNSFEYTLSDGTSRTMYGIEAQNNANPELKWERTAMLNVGLDFAFLGGRINGSIEYYDKKTSDLIWNYAVSTNIYPLNWIRANVGDISNKGVEFTLNVIPVRTKNFEWQSTINLSHNKNRVEKLSNSTYSVDYVNWGNPNIGGISSNAEVQRIMEGEPIGTFWTYQHAGYDSNGNSVFYVHDLDAHKDSQGNVMADTYQQDGNWVTSNPVYGDKTKVGCAQPKLVYGWNNTLNWGNWSLSAFLQGVIGNKILNATKAHYSFQGHLAGGKNVLAEVVNDSKWKADANAHIPGDNYLEKGDYLRLSSLTLGYTIKNLGGWAESLQLYGTCNNLLTLTNYSGIDPEVNLGGLDPGIDYRETFYPHTRSFIVGVKINFGSQAAEKKAPVAPVYATNNAELDRLNGEINRLIAENDNLRNRKPEIQKEVIRSKEFITYPHFVNFNINETNVQDREKVNLQYVAEMIKTVPDKKFSVVGYADKQTGSAERNAVLAQQRAKNVYDVLVIMYGVPTSQLTLDAKGGVDTMFLNDPQLSRSVIISEVK
ncbi:MAG: SusC/RagA family TonB-linked outer membrane protein [Prevotella sp.]|nr:SusC/RagA family TonB-linked outer membrane protein [Prevotella sp.]